VKETREIEPQLRITISGPAVRDGRVPLDLLAGFARNLQAVVKRIALVQRGEPGGRRGRPPADIARLTRLELVGFHRGSAVLELGLADEARPLADLDPGLGVLDAFQGGLHSLAEERELPAGWDAGVLVATKELLAVLGRGIDVVAVERPGVPAPPVRLTREVRDRIAVRLVAPIAQDRVTVEGRLLMADFDETKNRCRVHPPVGAPVLCVFTEAHREVVRELVTEYVRVTGRAELDETTQTIRLLEIVDIDPVEPPSGLDASAFWRESTIDEIAEEQGVTPASRIEELTADLWESEDDLEDFLAAIYESREAGLA